MYLHTLVPSLQLHDPLQFIYTEVYFDLKFGMYLLHTKGEVLAKFGNSIHCR